MDALVKSFAATAAEVIAQAADICGGPDNLAYILETNREDVWRWLRGERPPETVFKAAITVISNIRK
jgi:succinate dehydrogenase flavin-adding protein (antitoxin of CptAB toxin-antitoxin module)